MHLCACCIECIQRHVSTFVHSCRYIRAYMIQTLSVSKVKKKFEWSLNLRQIITRNQMVIRTCTFPKKKPRIRAYIVISKRLLETCTFHCRFLTNIKWEYKMQFNPCSQINHKFQILLEHKNELS